MTRWVRLREPEWGPKQHAFRAWKGTLSPSEQFSHCGNTEPHEEHKHDIHMTGEFIPQAPCVGTPDVMATPPPRLTVSQVTKQSVLAMLDSLEKNLDPERARAQRPGSQPLPIPQEGVAGAHDMVLSDLRGIMTRRQAALRSAGKTKEAEAIRQLLKEIEADLLARRALGLQRYGSLLQPGNGRDPLRDAYEEVVDLVAYFRQLIMARDEAIRELLPLKDALNYNGHAVIDRVIYLLSGDIKKGSNDVG